jgi:predicted DNA-binding transcriptional regulator AlpA
MSTNESLLNESEVARLLKISVATIRRRRLFRQPPEFVRIGASIRYRREAIERLIESGTCSPSDQPSAQWKISREHGGSAPEHLRGPKVQR